jgi:hypothetical protein
MRVRRTGAGVALQLTNRKFSGTVGAEELKAYE